MPTNLRFREVIRGKIIYYLALIYPQPATVPLLQGELDIFGYPVSTEQLNFHIAYLEEKGLVSVEQKRGPKSAREIALVKITAKGIDYPVKPVRGELTPDQRRVARKLLIDGATIEDVVLTLAAQGYRVPAHAVENFFRSDPNLPAQRVQHMLDVTRTIRQGSEKGAPEEVQLADAVIATGLMRLHQATAQLDVNDALRRRLEHENLTYRRHILRLKQRNQCKMGKLITAKTRLLTAQHQKVCQEFEQTIEKLKRATQGELSGPELAARIEEIYGLVKAPVFPAGPQPIED
jgi:hypothetical protein